MPERLNRFAQIAALVSVALSIAGSVEAKKQPKPPSQDAIVRGCVTVDNIYSQTMRFTTGAGVSGRVRNDCNVPADVFIKAAFFDASGNQLDNGLESQTVATHAQWPFFVAVPERFIHGFRCDVKVTRIIEVQVFGK
jgi:hypothetical protein